MHNGAGAYCTLRHRPPRCRRLAWVWGLLLLPFPAVGTEPVQVYRDPSGVTHYSDRPLSSPPGAVLRSPCAAGYRLQITEPQNENARISPAGQLQIRYRLQPELCADHRLQILVDGETREIPTPSGELLLQNLAPGAHRLRLQILGPHGKALVQSAAHRVYLL